MYQLKKAIYIKEINGRPLPITHTDHNHWNAIMYESQNYKSQKVFRLSTYIYYCYSYFMLSRRLCIVVVYNLVLNNELLKCFI